MATITLTEKDNQQRIQVAAGDVVEIRLAETPTTGYKWIFTESNEADWQVLSEDYQLSADSGIGGGGTKTIRLQVLNKNNGRLKLENRQPWSGDVYKTFEVSYE